MPWAPALQHVLETPRITSPAPAAATPASDDPRQIGLSPLAIAAPLEPLIGRDDEFDLVGEAIESSRLVTLVGLGGVGKTRLAREVALYTQRTHGRLTLFVDLSRAGEPELFAYTVASALGLHNLEVVPAQTQLDRVVIGLRHTDALLILDNAEHVLGSVQELVRRVGNECPHIQVLATSRIDLGLPGERMIRIEPLRDDAAVAALESMVDDPSQVRDHPEAAARVAATVGGLPLGLQVLAHLVDATSITDVDHEIYASRQAHGAAAIERRPIGITARRPEVELRPTPRRRATLVPTAVTASGGVQPHHRRRTRRTC